MIALLLALLPDAAAQSCVCSRNVALPTGVANRAGMVTVSLDYAVRQNGGKTSWDGFSVTDRHGDSMAGMAMPGHLVQMGTLDASVGVPGGFSLRAALPYTSITHLYPSEMPGDVDIHAIADATVAGRWAWRSKDTKTFLGVSAGLTLPTGKTTSDSVMRTGKGALGGTSSVQLMRKMSPLVGLAGVLAYNPSFFTPKDGYRVGSSANAAFGTRFTLRENGRLLFNTFGILLYQRPDLWDGYRYQDSGVTALDVSLGANWTFWEKKLRSMALLTRVELPLVQVVGDPPLAENWAFDVGIAATVF